MINFDYLKDWNNIAEQSMFFLNLYYIEERFMNPENQLAKVEHLTERKDLENDDTRVGSRHTILMNCFLIIMIFIKINTWMRLNDKFSNLYTLVIECVKDISLFMLYYLYYIVFFALIYMILGADFNVGEKAADYTSLS